MPFNRQTSLLWVGLVALAAALIAVQPRSSTRDDTSKTGKKTTETTPAALGQNDAGSWPGGGPLDPIRRFFLPAAPKGNAAVATNLPFTVQSAHVSAGSLAVTLAPTQPPADPYDWSKIDLTGYSIRFLIATVPDPADSGLGYLFDQTMAAIQRALEMEEYVIDRAWLPWKPSGAEAGKSGPDPRLQDKHPGLILFRRGHIGGEAKRSVLAMLLVGETPTSGIHKGAFQNAVRIIRNCPAEAMPETERERIRVVGPYFSGSSISLRTVLERALRDLGGMTEADRKRGRERVWPFPPIQVVCGGANGFDPHKFIRGWSIPPRSAWGAAAGAGVVGLGAAPFIPGPSASTLAHLSRIERSGLALLGSSAGVAFLGASPWGGGPFAGILPLVPLVPGGSFTNYVQSSEPAFTTTVLPEALLRKWVYKYLHDPTDPVTGMQPGVMVILRESNTWFGRSALKESLDETRAPHEGKGKPGEQRKDLVFMVPFPMHISQLRTNYTRDQQAKLESLGLPRSSRNLPLPQEEGTDSGKGHEGLPAQSPLMTGAMNDLILTSIVDTIAEKKARYVGLIATDVRDTIFLADVVRERFPDVQLFTTGSDILFTHPDYNYALKGMIVGSTYPLHPLSQSWSLLRYQGEPEGPERQRILFPDDGSQGYYNAILVHLTQYGNTPDQMMDYGWAEEDQIDPKGRLVTRPPIWISMVGQNNQMVPLCCIPATKIFADLGTKTEDRAQYGVVFPRPVRLRQTEKAGPQIRAVVFPNLWFLLFLAILVPGALLFRYAYRCVNRCFWNFKDSEDGISNYQQLADFALLCIPLVIFVGTTATLSGISVWNPDPRGESGSYFAACLVLLLSEVFLALVLGLLFWVYFVSARSPYRRWGWARSTLWGSIPALGTFLAVLAIAAYFAFFIVHTLNSPLPGWNVLWFERWVHLANGVTPLLPLFFLAAALFSWGVFRVKKLYLANQFSICSPFPEGDAQPFFDLNKLDGAIRSEITRPPALRKHPVLYVATVAMLAACFVKLLLEAIRPVDGGQLGLLALAGVFAGALLVLGTLLQFYLAWRKLKRLLRFIALLPMADAFDRLPDKVVALFGRYLSGERPRHSHLAIAVQQYGPLPARFQALRTYVNDLSRSGNGIGEFRPEDIANLRRALSEAFSMNSMEPLDVFFKAELNALGESDYEATSSSGKTAGAINRMSKDCFHVLRTLWPIHSMEEAFGRPSPAGGKAGNTKKFLSLPEGNRIREWALGAEDFVAIELIRYVSQFFVQLRNLVTPLTLGSLLLVLAAASYPFVPQHLLLIFLTALGGTVAATIVVFLIQVNRDELVSRITRSTPNQFTPDFAFLQGLTAYVLPIVGALMIQFPFFTSAIKSLLEPLYHIIK